MKQQCWKCSGWLFFKPFSDETFSCCGGKGERVGDIDLNTGVSPEIQKHNIDGEKCDCFCEGQSRCEPSEENSFDVPQIRLEGEEEIRRRIKK